MVSNPHSPNSRNVERTHTDLNSIRTGRRMQTFAMNAKDPQPCCRICDVHSISGDEPFNDIYKKGSKYTEQIGRISTIPPCQKVCAVERRFRS